MPHAPYKNANNTDELIIELFNQSTGESAQKSQKKCATSENLTFSCCGGSSTITLEAFNQRMCVEMHENMPQHMPVEKNAQKYAATAEKD